VSIGSNGLFKVCGYYEADPEKMACTCPDYRTRKDTCKHLFAALLFVKNRGKEKIEDLEGDWLTEMMNSTEYDKPKPEANNTANKPKEAHYKDFDRQATKSTRLAVLNTAVELLRSHRKPIEIAEVLSIASQLEQWALGN